jgi:hypothetical protein
MPSTNIVFQIKAFVYRLFFTGKRCNYSPMTIYLIYLRVFMEKMLGKRAYAGDVAPAYALFPVNRSSPVAEKPTEEGLGVGTVSNYITIQSVPSNNPQTFP